MNKLKYEDFVCCLKLGEEMEFLYKRKKFSISFSGDKCYLTEYYNIQNEQEYECIQDLIEFSTIDGKHLMDIWDDIDIDAIY